jgi:hypothetical protein
MLLLNVLEGFNSFGKKWGSDEKGNQLIMTLSPGF